MSTTAGGGPDAARRPPRRAGSVPVRRTAAPWRGDVPAARGRGPVCGAGPACSVARAVVVRCVSPRRVAVDYTRPMCTRPASAAVLLAASLRVRRKPDSARTCRDGPRPPRRRPSASTCSSASTTRPSCSSTPTASRTCRSATSAGLAPHAGGDRRSRHLLGSALRARPRDARTSSSRSSRTPPASTQATLAEIHALHEAVLAQHRAVQQPHRAQVRADVHARGVRPRRPRRPRKNGADVRHAGGESLDAMLARMRPLFFDPTVDPMVTQKTPEGGRDILAGQRQQPVRRRDDGRPEGLHREVRPQLASREAERQARRGGLQGRRPLRRPTIRAIIAHLEAAQAVRARRRWRGARAARAVVPHRRATPTAEAYDIAWVPTRPRRSTRSTASSRSTSTRAASRARGRRSSTT